MREFTLTKHIDAPIEPVSEILDDFGDIQSWNAGIKASELSSQGPIAESPSRRRGLRRRVRSGSARCPG
jgi:hypothetical protein